MSDDHKENVMGKDTRVVLNRDDLVSFFTESDHNFNSVHLSKVPSICQEEPCQLGIDEAGRGPVLGPMVYGVAYSPLSEKNLLVKLGCADSKSLTEKKRDVIFDQMCELNDKIGWAIECISPNVISNEMFRQSKISLNEISHNSVIGLIRRVLDAGANISEVYVDTVGPPESYRAKLMQQFPELKIVVAKKADSTYPIVSAASICAKVSRDHAIRHWNFREYCDDQDLTKIKETEYGSGYPNDPDTKKWLTKNLDSVFGFPRIVRFSWSTAEKILSSDALRVEWEQLEDEFNAPKMQNISSFFVKPKSNSRKRKHEFFSNRCLNTTAIL